MRRNRNFGNSALGRISGCAVAHPGRLHVLLTIEKIAQRSGGAERVLVELANALRDRGHLVEIATHEMRERPPFYRLHRGVIHTNLRPPRRVRRWPRRTIDAVRSLVDDSARKRKVFPLGFRRVLWLSRNGGYWRRLGRHIDLTKPDVVIAFLPPAISALAHAKPRHVPRKIGSTHNAPWQDFHNPDRWDPNPLDVRDRMRCVAAMDVFTVLLPEYRDFYPPDLRNKAVVVPNVVHPVPAERLAQREPRKVVLCVGRLSEVKQQRLLIDAWKDLAPNYPDWECHIFGTGPLEKELKDRIHTFGLEASVRLMGHTKKIQSEYLRAAILAHPAQYEGFPLAVCEALAAGLPVVGFVKCSGLNCLVSDGYNGLLVPNRKNPTAAFGASLRGVMENDALRRKLSANGPPSVACYSPASVYDKWESLIAPGQLSARKSPVIEHRCDDDVAGAREQVL